MNQTYHTICTTNITKYYNKKIPLCNFPLCNFFPPCNFPPYALMQILITFEHFNYKQKSLTLYLFCDVFSLLYSPQ